MATRADRAKSWVRGVLTRELPFKALAMALALILWAWVQTQQIVPQRTRVQVKWEFPEHLTWVEPAPKTLVVTIKGPQGLVRNVKKRTLRYDVDLADAEQGPVSIDFSSRAIKGIPEGVSVVQISPPGVEVQLDRRMERVVRVIPANVGEPDPGYRIAKVTVAPMSARITGPRSVVRNISEIGTDVFDVSGLTGNKTYEVALAPKSRAVNGLSDEPFKVTVEVEPVIAAKTFSGVPIMARSEGWATVPSTAVVTLSGPAADMLELTADRISVQAHLPNPVPVGHPLLVSFDPAAPGQGLEVVHQGPKDIKVIKVDPDTVRLERSK